MLSFIVEQNGSWGQAATQMSSYLTIKMPPPIKKFIMDTEYYSRRRDELIKIREISFSSLDKSLLTISSGAITLSATLLGYIGKPETACQLLILSFAWGALAITM